MAVVVAENLRRRYGETVALDGVSLSVAQGEVFALIGPNGAGKTTLVRALTGTTDAEGTVRLFGEPPAAIDRARIGLLPQAFDPPARLSARELLAYYRGLYEDGREVGSVLADVGLPDEETWYERLSGGQQRRACVGTALVNDPDLLVLDEPTTGIDPTGRRALWDLLSDLAAGGTTILLTTHDMEEAERLADRVGLLADGRLVAVGTPSALIAEHGGESRLTIETDTTDVSPEAIVRGYRVEPIDSGLAVLGVSPEDIGDVVADLEASGLDYEALAWRVPDLEDVYLRLTGTAVGSGGDPIDSGGDPAAAPTTGSETP